jgi:chemotaxis methyl-accepting protein methylase
MQHYMKESSFSFHDFDFIFKNNFLIYLPAKTKYLAITNELTV